MYLTITLMNGASHSMGVEPHMKVGDLKRLICQQLKVPVEKQKLSTDNGQTLSDDSKALSSYGLQSGSKVMLLIIATIQVLVINEKHQTKPYDVEPGETVTQLKAKVHDKEGVPADQQRLIHEGKELQDGKALEDYGIRANSTIYQTLRLRGGSQQGIPFST